MSDEKDLIDDIDTEDDDNDGYEPVCSMCFRPESKAGKLIKFAENMYCCNDCMQRSIESMQNMPFDMSSIMGHLPPNLDLSDLMAKTQIPKTKQVKKKKKEEKKEVPKLEWRDVPAPHILKAKLDEYVIGQDYAKKVISVGVYNHYKRILAKDNILNGEEVEIQKSNMLMIGPTGSGKTYLVQTIAKLLDVPIAITDATSLTEAGYIGDDVESVLSKLLAAADNDVDRAQQGIIFIDEVDKLAKKQDQSVRDVNGQAVQQGLLKLLEGSEVEVPVGASSKNAMVPMATIDTRNILFIVGGAFPDLEKLIKRRLLKKSGIGFESELRDKYDEDKNILQKVTTEDLRQFGMIPEFLGRLPIVFSLSAIDEDMLVKILSEPRNAILKQYEKLLDLDEVKLTFEEDALRAIARKALEKDVGARALRAVLEEYMLDIMYEIPKDDNIGEVIITKAYIEGTGGPVVLMRGQSNLLLDTKS